MKRFLFGILVLAGFLSALSANTILSSVEQKAIDDLLEYRIYAATLPSNDAINKLNDYKTQIYTDKESLGYSDEATLILDALVDLDLLPIYQATSNLDPRIQQIAEKQYKNLQGWMDSHKNETPNKWTYCLAAEAFDWYLSYLPMTQILTKGLLPKTYYQKALEQDPDMAYALCGFGQWQYFAPAFVGGGSKAAKASLKKAVQLAKSDADKFVTHLFYSQLLFEIGDKAGAETELAASEAICPDNRRLARFRQMNAAGLSWYEFARYYEDNRKKLSEPLVN